MRQDFLKTKLLIEYMVKDEKQMWVGFSQEALDVRIE